MQVPARLQSQFPEGRMIFVCCLCFSVKDILPYIICHINYHLMIVMGTYICFIHSVLLFLSFKIANASSKALDNLSVIGWIFWNSHKLGQYTQLLFVALLKSILPSLNFDKWIPKTMAVLGICLFKNNIKVSRCLDKNNDSHNLS